MIRSERDAYLRQGVVLPETPAQRRERENLDEDIRSIHQAGRPLPLRLRLRNFRPDGDSYLATAGGPLAYMLRLRAIEDEIGRHDEALRLAWHRLVAECVEDGGDFSARWHTIAASWGFERVNDLIDRHNRWYPAESRLPMDPVSGTYALVDGREYRLEPLDAGWILRRFPPPRAETDPR